MSLDRFRSVDIRIDKADHYFMSSQFAKGGDYNGRKLVVQITNGGLIETQVGITVNFGWRHESVNNTGLDPFDVVDASQGIFEINYPKEMLNPGRVTAVIQIIDGEIITETKNFVVQVEKSPIDETSIVSSNSFTVLQEALIKVNGWNARIDVVEQEFKDRADALDGAYPVRLNLVEEQLVQAATKAEVDVERTRINNIATLASGSTTGDAELIDSRTGYDGSAYSNSGGAMRGQVGKVAKVANTQGFDLTELTGKIYSTWQLGGIGVTGVPTIGVVSDARIHSIAIPISVEKDINISVQTGAKYAAFFYGTSGYISNFTYRTTPTSLAAKNNAVLATSMILVMGYTDDRVMTNSAIDTLASMITVTRSSPSEITNIKSNVDANRLLTYAEAGIAPISMTPSANINITAEIGQVVPLTPQTITGWNCAIVDCVAGDEFILNGTGGVSPRLYGFVDSNGLLLFKSAASLTVTNKYVVAPAGAAKLIINNNGVALSFKGARNIDTIKGHNLVSLASNGNITTGLSIGSVVTMTVGVISNFKCVILDCAAGDEFIVRGVGGNNPRLWAFVDANNLLLSVSSSDEAYSEKIAVISAPIGATKLIVNFNTTNNKPTELYISDNASLITLKYRTDKNAGAIQALADLIDNSDGILETPDDSVSAFINGIKFSDELKIHITDFAKPGDLMVHVSSFTIINDIVYVTYYANTISNHELASEHTARFVYCPLSDLNNKTFMDLSNIGDIINGKTVSAIYDIILLKKDDTTIYLMWTAALDGEYYRVYKTFNVATGLISDVMINTFTVGSTTNDFSITGMNSAFTSNGVAHKSLDGDIGIMQKITSRVEGGTTYYYTGAYVGPFNCIIKSSDLIHWIFVSQPDFTNDSQWENAVYVIGDKAYYFCRQYSFSQYGFLTYYDILNNTWAAPVMINDAQSRSDFFEYGGKLYLVHAPKDRNHLSIMQINQANLNRSVEIQVAKIPDYFYPFTQVYNGELYMSYTQSRQHIWLSKFTLGTVSTDVIIAKFKELFLNVL